MRLVISAHFLDRRFHGLATGRRPEWPPSPARLYQALLAGALIGGRKSAWSEAMAAAFRWLERLPPPDIFAPDTHEEPPVRLYVPTNDMDTVADAWARGVEPTRSVAMVRTAMDMRGQVIDGDGSVRYVWTAPPDDRAHARTMAQLARHLVALGHGEDFVAGDGTADEEASLFPGSRYWPDPASSGSAAPAAGFLDELFERQRLRTGGRPTVLPPLRCITALGYVSEAKPRRHRYRLTRDGAPTYFEARDARMIERAMRAAAIAAAEEVATNAAAALAGMQFAAHVFWDRIGTVTMIEPPRPESAIGQRLVGAELVLGRRRVRLAHEG